MATRQNKSLVYHFTEEMRMTIACSPTVAPLLTLSLYYPYCRWMHGGRQE